MNRSVAKQIIEIQNGAEELSGLKDSPLLEAQAIWLRGLLDALIAEIDSYPVETMFELLCKHQLILEKPDFRLDPLAWNEAQLSNFILKITPDLGWQLVAKRGTFVIDINNLNTPQCNALLRLYLQKLPQNVVHIKRS